MSLEIAEYQLVLKALGYALVEIRTSDSLPKAQALADVFHNVPSGIAFGQTPEEIRRRLDETAIRLGCQDYINRLFESALRNMNQ